MSAPITAERKPLKIIRRSDAQSNTRRVFFSRQYRPSAALYCRILSSDEFMRAPSQATLLAANGTEVCIEAGNVKIIVGSSNSSFQKRRSAFFFRKLQAKLVDSLYRRTRPLDLSWIE